MDELILRDMNGLSASPVVAAVALFLSSPWMALLVTIPLGLHLLRLRRYAAILSIALAMGASDAVNARIVKPMVERERPCRALEGLERPAGCGPGKSFASGHAAVSFAFAVSAAPTVPYGWTVFPVLAALVSGSRVVLGVHYPTDVTAGAILGGLIGAFCALARDRFDRRRNPPAPATNPVVATALDQRPEDQPTSEG